MAKIISVDELPKKESKLPPKAPRPTPQDFYSQRSAEIDLQIDLSEKRLALREKMRAERKKAK